MTNVSVVSAVALYSRPQILERVDVLERSVADVHLVQQGLTTRRFAVCTALSASEPRREPSHQRAAWIFIHRCVGNVREQASHLCASFRASTSASVVELTCVLWWICITLLLACDITIAASGRELRHDGRTLAHTNCNAGVLEIMHPEDPVQSCDKRNGREDVPLEYSSGDVEWLGECHHTIGVAEAHNSSGCREDSLYDATHLSSDSCLCEGLIQKHLTLRVERRTVVDKSYFSLSAFPKNHLYKSLKGADVVPAASCGLHSACVSGRWPSSVVTRRLETSIMTTAT